MPPIKIPSVPKSAYNPKRPAGDLLLAHIANLERALGRHPKNRKGKLNEGDAAAYIRHLSRHLHHRVLLPTLPTVATVVGVGLKTAPAPPRKTPARKKPARTSSRKKR
jgi:hypothetical protein